MTIKNVGQRVGVLDGSGTRFVGFGTYVGDDANNALGMPNPKIEMDDGSIKWGYECWWGPAEEIQKKFANQIPTA